MLKRLIILQRGDSMKSLTAFVIGCLVLVVLYVVTAVIVQIYTGTPLPDSLNVAVISLFGTELAVSGFIKVFKIKKGE